MISVLDLTSYTNDSTLLGSTLFIAPSCFCLAFYLLKAFLHTTSKFPVIVAYAVTIHKCQGLSLDCATVDLSSNVFCAGMAYVAISRVCTLDRLHLTAFDSESVSVKNSCIEEINRLHNCFRKDLPLYELSIDKKQSIKCEMVDVCDDPTPAKKKPKVKVPTQANK